MRILRFAFLILRIFLGSIFILSGFSKLVEPFDVFLGTVNGYQIVSGWMAFWVAAILPWIEMTAGASLAAGLWIRPATFILWAMNTVFIGAVASVLARNIPVESCGCFGENFLSLSLPDVLMLDSLLWLLFIYLIVHESKARVLSLDSYFDNRTKTHEGIQR